MERDREEPVTRRERLLFGTMAEGMAVHRFSESKLPEGRRICYDKYAIHFIDPLMLDYAKSHPQEVQALAEEYEQTMPGLSNSIRARVRYFDDCVKNAVTAGFSQMVILGAGYDTRAYRIDGLGTSMQVFEVDQPHMIRKKTEIITEIFGSLPGHVSYVSLDLECDDLWNMLKGSGYTPGKKTLFLMEGLVMYLPPASVERLLAAIVHNSGAGSIVLFDFFPRSLVDGSSDREGGRNIRDYSIAIGEPLLSGFAESEIGPFLTKLGYSDVKVVTSKEYREMYFHGKNVDRPVSGLMSFVSAAVPKRHTVARI